MQSIPPARRSSSSCSTTGSASTSSGPRRSRSPARIIAELLATLNVDAWDGADDLAALYGFLLRELIAGGAGPEVRRLRGAGTIVSDLRSSWYEAGQQLVGDISPVAAAGNAPASVGAWVA